MTVLHKNHSLDRRYGPIRTDWSRECPVSLRKEIGGATGCLVSDVSSSSRIWAELHEKAFRRLGGATRVVVLDNLREGVLIPDIYDPTLYPLYRDVLAHYAYLDRWETSCADTRIHGTTKRTSRRHVCRRKTFLAAASPGTFSLLPAWQAERESGRLRGSRCRLLRPAAGLDRTRSQSRWRFRPLP